MFRKVYFSLSIQLIEIYNEMRMQLTYSEIFESKAMREVHFTIRKKERIRRGRKGNIKRQPSI